MSRADEIRAALDKLGPTHNDIAQALTDRRITGVRNSGRCCPLANYLRAEGIRDIRVYPACVTNRLAYQALVNLTVEQMTFVDHFDAGHYPQLVDERGPR